MKQSRAGLWCKALWGKRCILAEGTGDCITCGEVDAPHLRLVQNCQQTLLIAKKFYRWAQRGGGHLLLDVGEGGCILPLIALVQIKSKRRLFGGNICQNNWFYQQDTPFTIHWAHGGHYLSLEVTWVGFSWVGWGWGLVGEAQGGGFEGMRALAVAWCWQGLQPGSGIRLKRWNLSPPSHQARISSGG